jgi:hypothetical protein
MPKSRSFKHKVLMFVLVAALIIGIALFLRAPLSVVITGLVGALMLARHSSELYQRLPIRKGEEIHGE